MDESLEVRNRVWLRDTVMKNHTVFPDEIETWVNLGFYIAQGKIEVDCYSPKAEMYCDLRMAHIPYEMGQRIRQSVMRNFYAPRQQAVKIDDLDELESRRG